MKTYSVSEGWAEGQWQSQQLRVALEAAGYRPARSEEADIIITHSGGCYVVPDENKAQLIMMIGIPYSPHKPILWSIGQKVQLDMYQHKIEQQLGYWTRKTFWNTLYLIGKPWRWAHMWWHWRKLDFPHAAPNCKIIAVRNEVDPFCKKYNFIKLCEERGWQAVHMHGHHDDCWSHPQPYVDIIKTALGET
jgi:hypothetical protein